MSFRNQRQQTTQKELTAKKAFYRRVFPIQFTYLYSVISDGHSEIVWYRSIKTGPNFWFAISDFFVIAEFVITVHFYYEYKGLNLDQEIILLFPKIRYYQVRYFRC